MKAVLPSIETIRAVVTALVSAHIQCRHLDVGHPYETARRAVEKWSDQRATMIYVRAAQENVWLTHSEVARILGCSPDAASLLWSGLRGVKVETRTGKVKLFRKGVELRFRGDGSLDGKRFGGAACLRLAQASKKGSAEDNRKIMASTSEATETYAANYNAAHDELDAAGETVSEQFTATRERTRVLESGAHGPQASLPLTGTGGR